MGRVLRLLIGMRESSDSITGTVKIRTETLVRGFCMIAAVAYSTITLKKSYFAAAIVPKKIKGIKGYFEA